MLSTFIMGVNNLKAVTGSPNRVNNDRNELVDYLQFCVNTTLT